MEVYDNFEQGSPLWDQLRIGSIGGSSISKAVALGEGKVRDGLMYDFVQEILSGEKIDHYVSWDMKQGIKLEPMARAAYELRTGYETQQIALVKHSKHKHYSPDLFALSDGLGEIKIRTFKVWDAFRKNRIIPKYERNQMQWGMWNCEKAWCDYITSCPYIERKVDSLIITRVERDDKEIKELDDGANVFIEEMQSLLIKVMKGG